RAAGRWRCGARWRRHALRGVSAPRRGYPYNLRIACDLLVSQDASMDPLTIGAIIVALLAIGAAVYLFVQLQSFTDPVTRSKLEFVGGDLGDGLVNKATTETEFRAKVEKVLEPRPQEAEGDAWGLRAAARR